MTDYKKYIFEVYGLNEMPSRVGNLKWMLDDGVLNQREADLILKTGKNIGFFKISEMSFRLYMENDDNIKTYYLIDPEHPFIHSYVSFREIENMDVWSWKYNKRLAGYFIENYILEKI